MACSRWRIALALLPVLALLVALALVLEAGDRLSAPAPRGIGPPPADLAARPLRIPLAGGGHVAGWHLQPEGARSAVLLLHGLRSDRRQMLGRARFLARAGHAVLLIDLPAHGESPGERIGFGARETAGVTAAIDFLRRELPHARIGIIGVSLGAAAAVLARPSVDAMVIESMYPTIGDAVARRLELRFGALGQLAAPLLLWQLPLRAGVEAAALRPIDVLPALGMPLLVAAGSEDRHTRWASTAALFDAARAPKELWRVDGAAHVDLQAFAPADYERRILGFFAHHLGDAPR